MSEFSGFTESTLTTRLRRFLPPVARVIKHSDAFRAGIPDVSMHLMDSTSWWEIKYANPSIISREVQRLEILHLSYHARVRYIIFDAKRGCTQIVEPVSLKQREAYPFCAGFNFAKIAQEMLRIHRL